MSPRRLFNLPRSAHGVREAALWLRAQCDAAAVPPAAGRRLEAIVAEVLNNCVEHGPDVGGAESLSLTLHVETGYVEALVRSPAGDPVPIEAWQERSGLDDPLAEGGRGWAIVRAWADAIAEETVGDDRIVRLRIDLPSADGSATGSAS